jgi:hypothetical protein
MRTIDSTLEAALASGHFVPYFKLRVYRNGVKVGGDLQVTKYKLTGNHLSVTANGTVVVSPTPNAVKLILDRGVTIQGTNYLLSTSKFTPLNGTIRKIVPKLLSYESQVEASLIPPMFISFAGDVSYQAAIEAFCIAIGKTAVFKVPAAAYWQYQFLPTGKTVTFNNANNFLALLRQKYFIFCCDNGNEEILFYYALHLPATPDAYPWAIQEEIGTGYFNRRRFFAKDEVSALRYAGTEGDVLHNLGFLHSTASLPSDYEQRQPISVDMPWNLTYQSGDYLYIDNSYACFPTDVIEVFDLKAHPGLYTQLRQLEYFTNTEGGALPSTIERVSNYTPLNVSNFNKNLDATINNLQAFAERVDDMDLGGGGASFNDGEGDPADVASTASDGASSNAARRDHRHKGLLGPSAGGSAIRAYLQSNTALSAGSYKKAPLNLESFDVLGEYDNATNYRFTAGAAGKYMFIGTVTVAGVAANNYIAVDLRKNGSSYLLFYLTAAVATTLSQQVLDLIDLAQNDYLELWVMCSNAATLNGGSNQTFLDVMKV